jgi:DNA helicase-2/ATP-dependent DNA helicase PcrA
VFPHYRSMTDRSELEEERRLAYVGITRAQQRLYLTHAWSRTLFGQTAYNPPSRFLGEIPEEMLDARESQGGGGRRRRVREERGRSYHVIGLPSTGDLPKVTSIAKREPAAVAPGDTVIHERFGEGVVLSVSGSGEDQEARVAFSDVGEKSLLLAYAPLRKLGPA